MEEVGAKGPGGMMAWGRGQGMNVPSSMWGLVGFEPWFCHDSVVVVSWSCHGYVVVIPQGAGFKARELMIRQ